MQKNKSYIWISFVVLVFGIYAIPRIIERIKGGTVVKSDRLDRVEGEGGVESNLYRVGKAPQFNLIDQNGLKISNQNYQGKVYVVEFFFTTCPTICPIMNKNMVEIQNEFLPDRNFGIASITINPENDTPAVLKAHAKTLKVTSPNWHFLSGNRDAIFNLANKGFSLYTGINPKIAGGFEHSGLFALIDKKGIIRCRKDEFGNPIAYYDGIERAGVEMLKKDIALLLEE
jgi:protein SCO1/2